MPPMPSSLMRLRPILLLAAGTLPVLAGCVQTGQAGSGSFAGCPAERAEFAAAAQALPPAPAASGEAYWTQLRQGNADTATTARELSAQLAAFGAAVDRIDTGYGALKTCRLGRAEALRAQIADATLEPKLGAQKLAEEKRAFDAELAQTRAVAARIAPEQAILQEAAERLVAAAPGSSVKVAKAVAASPVPATPYMVTQSSEIFARPDAGGARIADLRKGQRVQGPGGGPAAGWVTLTLNDGSLGYVDAGVLRPVQPNASALRSSAHAQALRNADGDPIVALALMARETVPEKSQVLVSMIEIAAEAAAAAFAAEPAATPSAALAVPGVPGLS
jgi:hypothetical protein